MKKKRYFKLNRPYVFVPMSADFFHFGHVNILLKAKKFGNIIVGLMTNKGIKSYKNNYPYFDFKYRKKVLKQIKCIDRIIPLEGLKYVKTATKYKFEYFVRGDDWKKGIQSQERHKLINVMKKWNGRVLEFKYTKGVSSTKIKKIYKIINEKK